MRPLAIVTMLLVLAGCIEHRAALAPSPDPTAPFQPERREGVVVGADAPQGLAETWSATGPLPVERALSAWFRAEEGQLFRAESRVATPLPWWQRFPADLATDLWPGSALASATASLSFTAVPRQDDQALTTAARAAGFAQGGTR